MIRQRKLPRKHSDIWCYIAGGMSGYADDNTPSFAYVAAWLRKRKYVVYPPHEIMHGGTQHHNPEFDHADYLRGDIEQGLAKCNAIVLLPGWTHSQGARDEFNYAAATGRFVFYFDPHKEELVRMDEWVGIE